MPQLFTWNNTRAKIKSTKKWKFERKQAKRKQKLQSNQNTKWKYKDQNEVLLVYIYKTMFAEGYVVFEHKYDAAQGTFLLMVVFAYTLYMQIPFCDIVEMCTKNFFCVCVCYNTKDSYLFLSQSTFWKMFQIKRELKLFFSLFFLLLQRKLNLQTLMINSMFIFFTFVSIFDKQSVRFILFVLKIAYSPSSF